MSIEADDIVRVKQSSLIALHRDAHHIGFNSRRVKAQTAGGYQSAFRGRGMEFDESRPYQPGDDIRSIDWRVTARSGQTHTKLYREERERPVLLWVDLSRSMFFGTRVCYKAVLAAKLAALFAWRTIQQGDRLGGLIFSQQQHIELRPLPGRHASLSLIQQLTQHPAWQSSTEQAATHQAPVQALTRLRQVSKPGSLIVLISDFRFFDEQCRHQLAQIARNNDVLMIYTWDPIEQSLPTTGRYRFTDGINETTVDSSDRQNRHEYTSRFNRHVDMLQNLARQHRIRFIDVSTADNMLQQIQSGLGLRPDSRSTSDTFAGVEV